MSNTPAPNAVEVADHIARMMASVQEPLNEAQQAMLAGSLGVWLNAARVSGARDAITARRIVCTCRSGYDRGARHWHCLVHGFMVVESTTE